MEPPILITEYDFAGATAFKSCLWTSQGIWLAKVEGGIQSSTRWTPGGIWWIFLFHMFLFLGGRDFQSLQDYWRTWKNLLATKQSHLWPAACNEMNGAALGYKNCACTKMHEGYRLARLNPPYETKYCLIKPITLHTNIHYRVYHFKQFISSGFTTIFKYVIRQTQNLHF